MYRKREKEKGKEVEKGAFIYVGKAAETREKLERKVEEARREEQRYSEELRKTREEVYAYLREELKNAISSEFGDSKKYDDLAKSVEALGWTSEAAMLRDIASDERGHRSKLESIWFKYFKVK